MGPRPKVTDLELVDSIGMKIINSDIRVENWKKLFPDRVVLIKCFGSSIHARLASGVKNPGYYGKSCPKSGQPRALSESAASVDQNPKSPMLSLGWRSIDTRSPPSEVA
jgi:hypothetical protein